MLSRVLQWLGLITVLVSLLVAIALFSLVEERVDITIQSADSAASPDPMAFVRDDLEVLHRDLDAVAKGLDSNLQRIGAKLSQLVEQDKDSAQAMDRLTAKFEVPESPLPLGRDSDLTGLRNDIAGLGETLAVITRRLEVEGGLPLSGLRADEESDLVPPQIEVAPQEPVKVEPQPVATGLPKPETFAPPPATPGGSFLSFKLPAASLGFDRPVHYRVIPSLSRVGFDGKSTLHDFSGVTSSVSGDVYANLADPRFAWHGAIECQAAKLRTGVDGRDEEMRVELDVAQHPDIHFEITGFEPAANGVNTGDKTAKGVVIGKMNIRGKARDLRMPVSISFDPSRRAVVKGEVALKLTDYGVPVPSQFGLISMQDGVMIWIELRARMIGAAKATHEGR